MPAHRPTPARDRLAPAGLALALAVAVLAGCGGGSSGSPAPAPAPVPAPAGGPPAAGTVTAGASCTLRYTLTASTLLAGTDPLLAQQWHLSNTGQNGGTAGEDLRALAAWPTTRGEGVRVTVIDDSIEVTHPDLRPNLVEGASRTYRPGNAAAGWPLPCTTDESHGTAVAGLAAARDGNAIGGAGVAPRAALVAYDALSSGLDADVADALTRDASATGVYHNSWGAPDNGALFPPGPSYSAAVLSGIASGRGGLGSIYVFSAGNGGCYFRTGTTGCVDEDSNYDGYANHRAVIAVCAVDDRGRRPVYGEPGANLVVCAPSSGSRSGITTTALNAGFRSDFTGTSASAPMVSGVVALMLSVNPRLTWRDVRLILAGTARQNDPTDPGWTTGFGYRFNHQYGFGVVDAKAAIDAARTWTSVGGASTLVTCGPFTRAPNLPLPDPSGATLQPVSDAITVSGCPITQIEWVEARLTAPHPASGDLRVRLTSPRGQVSRLADFRGACGGPGGSCGTYADWPFGSMRHLGEPADGTWRLEVTDVAPADLGTFQGWSLTIHGR